jgi:hypothetical protein
MAEKANGSGGNRQFSTTHGSPAFDPNNCTVVDKGVAIGGVQCDCVRCQRCHRTFYVAQGVSVLPASHAGDCDYWGPCWESIVYNVPAPLQAALSLASY